MKLKQIVFLLIFLVILIMAALIIKLPLSIKGHNKEISTGLLFPEFKKGEITKIEVLLQGKTTLLDKKDNTWWLVTGEKQYLAEQKLVVDLLARMEQLPPGDIISQNPEKQRIFWVDQSGAEAKLSNSQGKFLVHIFVGKNGPDFMSTYLRLDNSNKVYQVSDNLRSIFYRSEWRSRRIFENAKDAVRTLEVTSEKGTIAFLKDDGGWEIVKPAYYPVKDQTVTGMINALQSLEANDFISLDTLKETQTGLESPSLILKFKSDDGQEEGLIVGKENEKKLAYAKRLSDSEGFLVASPQLVVFQKPLDEIIDWSLMQFKPEQVLKVSLEKDQNSISLERDDKAGWKKSTPVQEIVDPRGVENFLNTWSNLRAKDIVGKGEFDRYQLDKHDKKVTVNLLDNGPQSLFLGRELENGDVFARKESGGFIYLISKSDYGTLVKAFR